MSLLQSEYKFKVSFEDLDPMNIVWNGNYMRYMEQARCDLLAKLNYTYADMKKEGYVYPIAKMKAKYIRPATFGDNLTLKLDVISIEPTLDIKYQIFNDETNDKIFEGSTMQIGMNAESFESVYTPPKGLVDAINEVLHEKI